MARKTSIAISVRVFGTAVERAREICYRTREVAKSNLSYAPIIIERWNIRTIALALEKARASWNADRWMGRGVVAETKIIGQADRTRAD